MNRVELRFKKWRERSDHQYVKAICKPCWELKYCPYGPLVENFPIVEDSEYKCRVFGHICPVFKVAEPLTETFEQRNIGRSIPNQVKMKVNRRDNFVCQKCMKNIKDEEVNYDHIIPFSKGGSSDVSNIRMLCETCNKIRGNGYEEEFLITNSRELYKDSIKLDYSLLEDLFILQRVYLIISDMSIEREEIKKFFLFVIKTQDVETDLFMWNIIEDLNIALTVEAFTPIKKKFELMRFRWGIRDNRIHNIEEIKYKYRVKLEYCFEVERILFRQLGFILSENILQNNLYREDKVENDLLYETVKQMLDNYNPHN